MNFLLACRFLFFLSLFVTIRTAEDDDDDEAGDKWKKKDIRDYSEADLEKLYDQWEDNDEDELEPDELPQHKRPQPKIDISKLDPSNPEAVIKSTKKGQTLMMFIAVSGNPTRDDTEQISSIWQQGLYNGNIEIQRYVVEDKKVLFVLNDGSKAFDVKDFLITQERCFDVTIEGKVYQGAGANKANQKGRKSENESKSKAKSTKSDKKAKEEKNLQKKKKTDSENESFDKDEL